jgi:hypothetical protein
VSQSRRGFRFLNVERHSSSILIEIDGLPQASLCLLSAADDARVAGNVDQNYDIPRMNLARLEQDCLSFLDCLRPPNRIGETDSRNPRSISNAQQIVPLAKVAEVLRNQVPDFGGWRDDDAKLCGVMSSAFLEAHRATLTQNGHGWWLVYPVAALSVDDRGQETIDIRLPIAATSYDDALELVELILRAHKPPDVLRGHRLA